MADEGPPAAGRGIFGETAAPPDTEALGFLLLDKRPGRTSFESLGAVKKALGTGRVGHTGTLDKFASGLLLVLVGRAAKLSPWVSHCDKRYQGTIRFGEETDTLDPEGDVIAQGPLPSPEQLQGALAQFRGAILQTPPLYSAIHVEGRRASELARSGKRPEMKTRPVTIHALELLSWEPPLAQIRVHCSSGTYIRSLARDIALACGSRAHLVQLRRVAVAGFSVDQALPDPGLTFPENAGLYRSALRPIDRTLFEALGIPRFDGGEEIRSPMIRGRPLGPLLSALELTIPGPVPGGTPAAAVFAGDRFAGMVERTGDTAWRYGYVYARDPAGAGGPHAGH
jgi:tRNA pseudouridine55 synthase